MKYRSESPTKHRRALCLGLVLSSTLAVRSEAQSNDVQIDARGHLSVEVRDADPVAVIQKIADQAPFKLVVSDGVQAIPGSWSFSDLPLEAGIGRVLDNLDYILVRRVADESDSRVARVWILSKSTPVTRLSVSDPSSDADPTDTRESLQEAFREITVAMKSAEPDRTEVLLRYLDHPNRRVRLALANALGKVGDPEALSALGQLLFGDTEAPVRRAAATALAQNQSIEAIEMLRGGLEDTDPQVKRHINNVLAEIDGR